VFARPLRFAGEERQREARHEAHYTQDDEIGQQDAYATVDV